ncbi:MAG: hypothetical protein ACYC5Y_12465 [Symbiobacteriia bacterium]
MKQQPVGPTQEQKLMLQMANNPISDPFPKEMQIAPGPEPLPNGATRIKAINVDSMGEWKDTGWLVIRAMARITVDADPSVTAVRFWIAPYQSDFTEDELKGSLAQRDTSGDTDTTHRWVVVAHTGVTPVKMVVVAGAWTGATFAGYSQTLGIAHGQINP